MITDARFEVLGAPFSLLSASISASQNLYTRKGTLVGFNGKAENVSSTGNTCLKNQRTDTEQATSTLSLLEPFRRAVLGIPFIYQRVSSTTPYTALISTKSSLTSLVVVHLDGRLDWMITQRNALLAWTGHTLKLSPRVSTKMVTRFLARCVTSAGLTMSEPQALGQHLRLRSRPPGLKRQRPSPPNPPQNRRRIRCPP